MKSSDIPNELPIALDDARALSLECWRLRRLGEHLRDSNTGSGLRHAVRLITDTLSKMGIEVLDFAGRTYDPGMTPEVVEVKNDGTLPVGHAIIDETIAPTVIWRGQVISPGQIIVRRSDEMSQKSNEGMNDQHD